MKITWLGHAGIYIEGSKNIVIDPWLNPEENPKAAFKWNELGSVDFVVCTHNHFDHFNSSAVELAKRDKAKFISVFETGLKAQEQGVPQEQISGGNKGGSQTHDGVTFTLVEAVHSGDPSGVVIQLDGHTFYHAGDTDVFPGMQLIGELYQPDVAFLPIGSHFTMGPKEAAKAVELLGSSLKTVIPIHYGTFPILVQSADEFVNLVKDKVNVVVLEPGKSFEL